MKRSSKGVAEAYAGLIKNIRQPGAKGAEDTYYLKNAICSFYYINTQLKFRNNLQGQPNRTHKNF